jgi:CRISPR-associated protein Csb2
LHHPNQSTEFQRADRPGTFASRVLAGKELDGARRSDHGHAFYLPSAEGDDRRRITHVTVVAADGLGVGEVAALHSLRELHLGESTLRAQLVGLGRQTDFRCGLFAESRTWASATPFVVTRHLKRRGTKRDPRAWWAPEGRSEFVRAVVAEERARQAPDVRPTIEVIEPGAV